MLEDAIVPVIVHVSDKERIEGVQVSTEDSKLISYCAVLLVPLCLPLHA